jgi:tripartite-type tricarboxylate transporter receptor subunit TctC
MSGQQFWRGASACAAFFAALPAQADAVADFYAAHPITIVIGSQGGGSYDVTARLAARFLTKYTPGNPAVVLQNMPGASHVRAQEYLANLAPKDGSTLAFVQPSVVMNAITNPGAKYNPAEMTWIGRLQSVHNVGFSLVSSGVLDVRAALTKPLIVGAAGSTGPAAMVPWALNRMIGTKFKVVRGYADDTAEFVAFERGEIQAMGSANYASVVRHTGWLDKGFVSLLYTISTKRKAAAPDTPAIVELVDSPRDKAVMSLLGAMPDIGITIQAPAKIPAERTAALREAAWKMFQDPEFAAGMRGLELDVDPLRGEDVAEIVRTAMATPKDAVDALKELTAPMD